MDILFAGAGTIPNSEEESDQSNSNADPEDLSSLQRLMSVSASFSEAILLVKNTINERESSRLNLEHKYSALMERYRNEKTSSFRLKSELEEVVTQKLALTKKLASISEVHEKSKAQIAAAEHDMSLSKGQLQSKSGEISLLRDELLVAKSENEKLEREVAGLEEYLNDRSRELKILIDENVSKEKVLEKLVEQNSKKEKLDAEKINSLQSYLDSRNEEIERLISALESGQVTGSIGNNVAHISEVIPDNVLSRSKYLGATKLSRLLRNFWPLSTYRSELKLIERSGLFDPDYYRGTQSALANLSESQLLKHYLVHGGHEGVSPSELVDLSAYLNTLPSECRDGTNPLVHYIRSLK